MEKDVVSTWQPFEQFTQWFVYACVCGNQHNQSHNIIDLTVLLERLRARSLFVWNVCGHVRVCVVLLLSKTLTFISFDMKMKTMTKATITQLDSLSAIPHPKIISHRKAIICRQIFNFLILKTIHAVSCDKCQHFRAFFND